MSLESPGRFVAIIGAPARVPLARLRRELERRGAQVTRRVKRNTQVAVIAHGAVGRLVQGQLEPILARAALVAEILSEHQALRALGLLDPPPAAHRPYDLIGVLSLSGLAAKAHLWLELFDVFEPVASRYAFRDLVIAREIRRLLQAGVTVPEIIAVVIAFRRQSALEDIGQIGSLIRVADGGLALRIGHWIADIDGQFRLPLAEAGPITAGELYDRGEQAEATGDWAMAERLYRGCIQLDPNDALAYYNCANSVRRQGRGAEAAAYLQYALRLDPRLADAWYNLGHLLEERGDLYRAIRCLETAIACDPHYVDAVFNLAMLHLRHGEVARALELFERYAAADPESRWGKAAKEAALMCRLRLRPRAG